MRPILSAIIFIGICVVLDVQRRLSHASPRSRSFVLRGFIGAMVSLALSTGASREDARLFFVSPAKVELLVERSWPLGLQSSLFRVDPRELRELASDSRQFLPQSLTETPREGTT
jgi:hypothetical protein